MPIVRNGKYAFEFANIVFEADPAVGGRIVTFSLGGSNVLTNSAMDKTNSGNYGSTFWPSPQMWGGSDWPPIPEVDNLAYTPSIDGAAIVMKQPAASARGKLSVTKRFTAVPSAQAIDVQYTLTNNDTATASWAPWEISRVAQGGITFFPTGTAVVPIAAMKALVPASAVTTSGGITWYKNTASDKGKYVADGAEGWLAQVSGDLLHVKRFKDIPAVQAAPGEADVEIYAGGSDGYVEVEPQGAYEPLQPGASLTWTVRWYVRRLVEPSIATVGSAALVTLVRDVVKQ